MKNLLFSLIATVIFGFAGNAQKIVSGKITDGITIIDVPKEVSSSLIYKDNSSEFTSQIRYSERLGANINLVLDSKYKIVGVSYGAKVSPPKLGPIGQCLKDCMGSSGSESGAWLCYWACITGI